MMLGQDCRDRGHPFQYVVESYKDRDEDDFRLFAGKIIELLERGLDKVMRGEA